MQLNSAFSLVFLTPLSGFQQWGRDLLTAGRVATPSNYISKWSPTHLWPITKGSIEFLLCANYWAQTMRIVQTSSSMSVTLIIEDQVPGPGILCGREPKSRPHSLTYSCQQRKTKPNLLHGKVTGLIVTQNVISDLEHYWTPPIPMFTCSYWHNSYLKGRMARMSRCLPYRSLFAPLMKLLAYELFSSDEKHTRQHCTAKGGFKAFQG